MLFQLYAVVRHARLATLTEHLSSESTRFIACAVEPAPAQPTSRGSYHVARGGGGGGGGGGGFFFFF